MATKTSTDRKRKNHYVNGVQSKNNIVKKKKTDKNPNLVPLGKNKLLAEKQKSSQQDEEQQIDELKANQKQKGGKDSTESYLISTKPASQQLHYFLDWFQSANKFKLSPLELEAYKDTCMVELVEGVEQGVEDISDHIKAAFGTSWKEQLSDGKNSEEDGIEAGSPALLVISTSALRSLELLRGLKPLTRECPPVKLFAKHMKVEEQVEALKKRVNIASGTPNRIKKLLDLEALTLSRSKLVVLDMERDVKGYSLFTLPQISAEFWDLYKTHFQERLLQGNLRICFYGAVPCVERKQKKVKALD